MILSGNSIEIDVQRIAMIEQDRIEDGPISFEPFLRIHLHSIAIRPHLQFHRTRKISLNGAELLLLREEPQGKTSSCHPVTQNRKKSHC